MAKNNIDTILSNIKIVDIVSNYVNLTLKGKNFWGVCPFHGDHNPSMSVSPDKNIFNCFSCGKKGNAVTFVMLFKEISFIKAVEEIAKIIGIEFEAIKYEKVFEYTEDQLASLAVLEDLNNLFLQNIRFSQEEYVNDYLVKRGLTKELLLHFDIGYCGTDNYVTKLEKAEHSEKAIAQSGILTDNFQPFFKNRLMFGIRNEDGKVVAFSGRDLSDNKNYAKYLNSPETIVFKKADTLYNYSRAKEAIIYSNEVIIVEGFMDVIAFYKDNIKNVVAIMGTALTPEHCKLLKNKKVILCLDGDQAGVKATLKSLQTLVQNNIDTFVVENTSNLDPDDFFTKNGSNSLKNLLTTKIPAIDFIYEQLKKEIDFKNSQTIINFVNNFSTLLAKSPQSIIDFYLHSKIKELNIDREYFELELKKAQTHNVNFNKWKQEKRVNDFFHQPSHSPNYEPVEVHYPQNNYYLDDNPFYINKIENESNVFELPDSFTNFVKIKRKNERKKFINLKVQILKILIANQELLDWIDINSLKDESLKYIVNMMREGRANEQVWDKPTNQKFYLDNKNNIEEFKNHKKEDLMILIDEFSKLKENIEKNSKIILSKPSKKIF